MPSFWTITGQRTTQREKRMQPLIVDYQRGPVPTKASIPLLMSKEACAKDTTPSLLPSPSNGPLQLAQATKHWSSRSETTQCDQATRRNKRCLRTSSIDVGLFRRPLLIIQISDPDWESVAADAEFGRHVNKSICPVVMSINHEIIRGRSAN